MLPNQMGLDFSLILITFFGATLTYKFIFNFLECIIFIIFHILNYYQNILFFYVLLSLFHFLVFSVTF